MRKTLATLALTAAVALPAAPSAAASAASIADAVLVAHADSAKTSRERTTVAEEASIGDLAPKGLTEQGACGALFVMKMRGSTPQTPRCVLSYGVCKQTPLLLGSNIPGRLLKRAGAEPQSKHSRAPQALRQARGVPANGSRAPGRMTSGS